MSQETRDERIKRLMREREEGTLTEKPAVVPIEEARAEPEGKQQDWEEESRIISAKNRERIKKNAELAAVRAKTAGELAERGTKEVMKSLGAFKTKIGAKVEGLKEKRRLKREERDAIKGAEVEVLANKSSRESSAGSSSAQRQTRMKFWILFSIPIALCIALIAVWLFKTNNASERVKPAAAEQVKTDQPATTQVLAPVQAVLPIVEEPPQALPPLPQETQAEDPELEVPAAIAEKRPEAKRQIVTSERAAKEKAVEKRPQPAKSEWQKDAAQKLEDYQF
ncbi:hypothetical protein [Stenotrophomonas maltophilia]|uniref:hypothetical protein n=1 Tax=Stenotrophomonas maltophilia TaxID=40324 RepID=UPI0015DE1851|nr:hypothetical protein [Stenotrophomonas maltophilia]